MGDDQNAHVIICLSHLKNLLFKEFYEKNVENTVKYYLLSRESKAKNAI